MAAPPSLDAVPLAELAAEASDEVERDAEPGLVAVASEEAGEDPVLEDDMVVLASLDPPTTVLPPITMISVELPACWLALDCELTWVKGTAEPAVQELETPRLIELSFGSPWQQVRSFSSSLAPIMLPSQQ